MGVRKLFEVTGKDGKRLAVGHNDTEGGGITFTISRAGHEDPVHESIVIDDADLADLTEALSELE